MKTKLLLNLILFTGIFFGLIQTVTSQEKQSQKRQDVFKTKKSKQVKSYATSNAKTAAVSRPGKSANYFWNSLNNQWVFNDSSVYTYNFASWLTSETHYQNGMPTNRSSYTYDNQGRETENLFQTWNSMNNTWDNVFRTVTIFDAQGNEIESRSETYSTQWDISYGSKHLITYDGQNRITEDIYQDYINNTWVNDSRETGFIYNGNNVTQYESQSWNMNAWSNDLKTVLVYGLNNIPVQVEFLYWNNNAYENSDRYINLTFHNWCGMFCDQTALSSGTLQTWGGNSWDTDERFNSIYDVYGGYVQISESYINSVWVNDYRSSSIYDNQSNYVGFRSESWNSVNNTWDIDYEDKEIHTYNGSNQITETIWQYWDSQNSQLENNNRKVYSDFQVFTSIKETTSFVNVSLYPNPCTWACTFELAEYAGLSASELELKIINLQGKEVQTQRLEGTKTQLNFDNLNSGMYFYHLCKDGHVIKTGKWILN